MAEPNPFAFTGPNVPQPQPSNATSQTELSKLRRENSTLQREKAALQRDMDALKGANGVARIMADAKKEVQAHEREVKRAQMAEKIARDALTACRNTANILTTPNTPKVSDDEKVKQKDKRIDELEVETTDLQMELELMKAFLKDAEDKVQKASTINHDNCERALHGLRNEFDIKLRDNFARFQSCKLENEQLKNEASTTIANLKSEMQVLQDKLTDLNDKFEERVQKELEDAHTKITMQQDQLAVFKNELAEATADIKHTNLALDEARTMAEKAEAYNTKLAADIKDKEDLNKHISDINDGLRSDLAEESARYQTLCRERTQLEECLAETQLALQSRERSESQARGDLAVCKAELERAAAQSSEHYEGLQTDLYHLNQAISDSNQTLLVKDERIAHLESGMRLFIEEKSVLENKVSMLENQITQAQAHAYNPEHEELGQCKQIIMENNEHIARLEGDIKLLISEKSLLMEEKNLLDYKAKVLENQLTEAHSHVHAQIDESSLRQELDQLRKTILEKDEDIACLEDEKRQLSVASNRSLQQELEEGGISDLDDDHSSEASSQPPVQQLELQLSAVADIVSLDPESITEHLGAVVARRSVAMMLTLTFGALVYFAVVAGYKLQEWEQANGVGLDEGYSLTQGCSPSPLLYFFSKE
ncbi:hypothetical protein SVAN01_01571 [Stagonosporopsis vannaccii]|nr:hypothetical protein SVAN01_01571 [Stagonosporopsis vannaccii]